MAQQELDRLKKATDILGLTAQQQTMIDSNALHGLSLPTAYPGLSGLPPVLLPGVNGPPSLPGFPPNTPALASPGAGMLGFPSPATPSPAMSLSSAPSKPLLQTHPANMTSQQTEEQSKNMEKEKKNDILKPKEASETKEDKGSSTESTKEEPQTDTKSTDFLDAYIVPSIKHEFVCRKCQVTFADEESAVTHQKSFCYFGQPFIDPQDTVLHNQVSKYNCLACDVAISGNEALGQHLQSSLHKEKTIKQAMRNAKEHARLLPHSVCSPNPNTTSTSQSAASSNNTYPHLSRSSMKSWPNILFQASARKAASFPSSSPPSLSLPSTVTSTSCSTSGVQTSLPTESCSDESDSELSQKLDDLDHSLEVKTKTASGLDGNFNSIRMDMFSV
ncbi:UNVERIFIED_CONTAM: hypothetical protein FKN15_022745 [Acipenser sinensis]